MEVIWGWPHLPSPVSQSSLQRRPYCCCLKCFLFLSSQGDRGVGQTSEQPSSGQLQPAQIHLQVSGLLGVGLLWPAKALCSFPPPLERQNCIEGPFSLSTLPHQVLVWKDCGRTQRFLPTPPEVVSESALCCPGYLSLSYP